MPLTFKLHFPLHLIDHNTRQASTGPVLFVVWSKLLFFIVTVCPSYRRDEVRFHYLCVFNSLQLAVFPHLLDKSIDFVSKCSFYLQSNTKWIWLWCVLFSLSFPTIMCNGLSISMYSKNKNLIHINFFYDDLLVLQTTYQYKKKIITQNPSGLFLSGGCAKSLFMT